MAQFYFAPISLSPGSARYNERAVQAEAELIISTNIRLGFHPGHIWDEMEIRIMSAGNNAYTCAVIDACLQIISQLTMAHIFDDIQTLDVYRMMPDQSPEKAKFVVMMHNRFHDLDKLRLDGRNQDMVDMLGSAPPLDARSLKALNNRTEEAAREVESYYEDNKHTLWVEQTDHGGIMRVGNNLTASNERPLPCLSVEGPFARRPPAISDALRDARKASFKLKPLRASPPPLPWRVVPKTPPSPTKVTAAAQRRESRQHNEREQKAAENRQHENLRETPSPNQHDEAGSPSTINKDIAPAMESSDDDLSEDVYMATAGPQLERSSDTMDLDHESEAALGTIDECMQYAEQLLNKYPAEIPGFSGGDSGIMMDEEEMGTHKD